MNHFSVSEENTLKYVPLATWSAAYWSDTNSEILQDKKQTDDNLFLRCQWGVRILVYNNFNMLLVKD